MAHINYISINLLLIIYIQAIFAKTFLIDKRQARIWYAPIAPRSYSRP